MGAKVAVDPTLLEDSNIVEYSDAGIGAFILSCSSQILEMNYTYYQGRIADVNTRPASQAARAAITNPFQIPVSRAWDSLIISVRQEGLSSSVDALAASVAQAYSHTMLSKGVSAVVRAPALQESRQTMQQVTRMPKAPFFTLIALNCLYAVVGAILAIAELASRPRTVKPVVARLSVQGLIAGLLQDERAGRPASNSSQLFEENDKGYREDVCKLLWCQRYEMVGSTAK